MLPFPSSPFHEFEGGLRWHYQYFFKTRGEICSERYGFRLSSIIPHHVQILRLFKSRLGNRTTIPNSLPRWHFVRRAWQHRGHRHSPYKFLGTAEVCLTSSFRSGSKTTSWYSTIAIVVSLVFRVIFGTSANYRERRVQQEKSLSMLEGVLYLQIQVGVLYTQAHVFSRALGAIQQFELTNKTGAPWLAPRLHSLWKQVPSPSRKRKRTVTTYVFMTFYSRQLRNNWNFQAGRSLL